MINLENLSESHEELFPKASLESQIWKLEEELKEYDEATELTKQGKELADCIIVCGGLYRFVPVVAKKIAQCLLDCSDINLEWIEKEINRKWNVNQIREWAWDGKVYKHKGKDGNE